LRAFDHARQMSFVYEPTAFHPPQYSHGYDKNGKPSGRGLTSEQAIDGHQKISAYLDKVCTETDGCASFRKSESDAIYASLKVGLSDGSIKDSNAIVVARGFMKGYAYFEPTKARQIDALLTQEAVTPHKRASNLPKP
jgi:hypothetical protein